MASAKPAAPELISTAVPPAKSSTPRLASHPPLSAVVPSTANIQCATGKYTSVAHNAVKAIHGRKRIRSATAPAMSATVTIANPAWNMTNTSAGIFVGPHNGTEGAL
ncbi:Uncharacterised protein [Mycobacteroides abscessus subsp. abscessus]|nr:Uncharacterised protein [Mycobacteroides abscessus subsp. abscessus]